MYSQDVFGLAPVFLDIEYHRDQDVEVGELPGFLKRSLKRFSN